MITSKKTENHNLTETKNNLKKSQIELNIRSISSKLPDYDLNHIRPILDSFIYNMKDDFVFTDKIKPLFFSSTCQKINELNNMLEQYEKLPDLKHQHYKQIQSIISKCFEDSNYCFAAIITRFEHCNFDIHKDLQATLEEQKKDRYEYLIEVFLTKYKAFFNFNDGMRIHTHNQAHNLFCHVFGILPKHDQAYSNNYFSQTPTVKNKLYQYVNMHMSEYHYLDKIIIELIQSLQTYLTQNGYKQYIHEQFSDKDYNDIVNIISNTIIKPVNQMITEEVMNLRHVIDTNENNTLFNLSKLHEKIRKILACYLSSPNSVKTELISLNDTQSVIVINNTYYAKIDTLKAYNIYGQNSWTYANTDYQSITLKDIEENLDQTYFKFSDTTKIAVLSQSFNQTKEVLDIFSFITNNQIQLAISSTMNQEYKNIYFNIINNTYLNLPIQDQQKLRELIIDEIHSTQQIIEYWMMLQKKLSFINEYIERQSIEGSEKWQTFILQTIRTKNLFLLEPFISKTRYYQSSFPLDVNILLYLCGSKFLDCIDLFLLQADEKFDINAKDKDNNNILHHIINYDSPHIVKRILNTKIDINAVNFNDETPLLIAVQRGNIDITKKIIKRNPIIKYRVITTKELTVQIITPLTAAIKNHNFTMVELLLKNEKVNDPTLQDQYGNNALHIAIKYKHPLIISELIKNINVNIPNKRLNTPVHFAVKHHCSINIFEILVIHGQYDLNIKDQNGHTALSLFLQQDLTKYYSTEEKKEIVSILRSNKSKINNFFYDVTNHLYNYLKLNI